MVLGHITKRGSRWLRWSLMEVVYVVVRVRNSVFRVMYLRIVVKWGLRRLLWLLRVSCWLLFGTCWLWVRCMLRLGCPNGSI